MDDSYRESCSCIHKALPIYMSSCLAPAHLQWNYYEVRLFLVHSRVKMLSPPMGQMRTARNRS